MKLPRIDLELALPLGTPIALLIIQLIWGTSL